jgi:hypothetical protein
MVASLRNPSRKRTGCLISCRSDAADAGSSEIELQSSDFKHPKTSLAPIQALTHDGQPNQTMKKLICILAGAALLGACEQKTETVAPAPGPDKKTENNTTVVNPVTGTEKTKETNTSTSTNSSTSLSTPNSSTKTESTTTTSSSPNP